MLKFSQKYNSRCSPLYICKMQQLYLHDLGKMSYQPAWDYQEKLLQENLAFKASGNREATRHFFLLVEHPPVYTLGKSGLMEHVLIDEDTRIQKGIEFFKTNRGGDITYHGPGQIVGYPILDLEKIYTDIGKYLRNLEEVIIRTMAYYGLKGERSPGETGVWMDPSIPGRERKICAMGVRCSRWITMHGFAFNVNTDLSYFDMIIPCGIRQKSVTSLELELGKKPDMEEVKEVLTGEFEKVFELELNRNWHQV